MGLRNSIPKLANYPKNKGSADQNRREVVEGSVFSMYYQKVNLQLLP